MQIRKSQKLTTAVRRDPMQATGLDDYVTASAIAYKNNKIPTMQMEDKKHILFKPDYKRFDAGEESQIQNFENRGK